MSAPTTPPKPRRRQLPSRLLKVAVVIGIAVLVWGVITWLVVDPRPIGSRRARAMVEIDQLHTAVTAFRVKMNVMHLPAGFRLKAAYDPAEPVDPNLVYLRQVFPQLDFDDNGLPPGTDDTLDPNQTLVIFLTGGKYTNYQGFSRDKQHPFRPAADAAEVRIGPFLDVSPNRLDGDGRYLDPWGTPYAYFAYDPALNAYPDRDGFGVRPYRLNGKAMNPKGWQIVSAGPDGKFGPGGDWTPGEGPWAAGGPGADDLSNFNSGPLSRREQ